MRRDLGRFLVKADELGEFARGNSGRSDAQGDDGQDGFVIALKSRFQTGRLSETVIHSKPLRPSLVIADGSVRQRGESYSKAATLEKCNSFTQKGRLSGGLRGVARLCQPWKDGVSNLSPSLRYSGERGILFLPSPRYSGERGRG